MDLFSCLPEFVGLEILSSWSELKSAAYLDTAFCNMKERQAFLKILSSNICEFESETLSINFMDWVALRKIHLTTLFFKETYFSLMIRVVDGTEVLKIDLSHITSLVFEDLSELEINDEGLILIINSCPNLITLYIGTKVEAISHHVITSIDAKIWKQMQQLGLNATMFDIPVDLTSQCVTHIAQFCVNLIHFEYATFRDDLDLGDGVMRDNSVLSESIMIDLMKKNPKLTSLCVYNCAFGDAVIDLIIKNYPKFTSFSIT